MDDRLIGRVVNVNDPERAGRVQIRVFNEHNDEVLLPDSELPWARCVFPVTNPINNGISGPVTGMIVGSTVVGRWLDNDHQVPIVEGTLGRSINADGTPGDFPALIHGDDTNPVLKDNITTKFVNDCKLASAPTIGNVLYTGQSITSLISSIDKNNPMLTALQLIRFAKDALNIGI